MVQSSALTKNSEGILIGQEIGEWAGFRAGMLTIKTESDKRINLRYSINSEGDIPPIGSEVSVKYTSGPFPEIVQINVLDEARQEIYKQSITQYDNSLIFNRPRGAVIFTLVAILAGLSLTIWGCLLANEKPMAPLILGGCGIPQILLGILLWDYSGK